MHYEPEEQPTAGATAVPSTSSYSSSSSSSSLNRQNDRELLAVGSARPEEEKEKRLRFDLGLRRRRRPMHGRPQKSKSQVLLPRLVKRDMAYNQSSNRMAVCNTKNIPSLYELLAADWFHFLLRVPTALAVLFLIFVWTIALLIFACIYVAVDGKNNIGKDCGLGNEGEVITFAAAFAFAMETATTVGYGLPSSSNAFFNDGCAHVQVTIYFQMIFNMLFNAFMFAFFFSQLSKSETRSVQVVFSNKLVINVKENRVYASVRCYDLDSAYPLVEAHARMYLLDHKLKLKPLRLIDPDDNRGGMMHPSIPQEIIHEIDFHSALNPRTEMPFILPKSKPGVDLRNIDSNIGSRSEIYCPVCGDTFCTYEQLRAHVNFNKLIEEQEDYPVEGSHRSFVMPSEEKLRRISLHEVQDHIERTLSEIVVVVEAIDPQLSGTFQSLHSYKYENIEFGADFEHCMTVCKNKITVDMKRFHNIKHTDHDSLFDCYDCEKEVGDNESSKNARKQQRQEGSENSTLSKILEEP